MLAMEFSVDQLLRLCKIVIFHYLEQDYLFFRKYTRVYYLAIYKSRDIKNIKYPLCIANAVLVEVDNHLKYCNKFLDPFWTILI